MLEPEILFETLQTVSDAVLITGPGGEIRWANAAFTALTGYSGDEVAGKNPRLLKSGTHEEAFYRDLWSTILSGRAWTGEMTNRRKDGSLYQERQTITPVRDAAGRIAYFIAVKRDLTRERAREERETILHMALDGFVVVDAAGRILETNDAYCHMTGYAREELLRMSIPDLEGDQTPEEIEARKRGVAGQGQGRFETRHRRKDGNIIELDVSVNYLPGSGRFCVFLRDITERKRAERALRESEERCRTLVDSLVEGIVVRDRQGVATMCNASAMHLLGVPEESLLGPLRGCGCELLLADGTPCPRGEEPSAVTLRTGKPCSDVVLGVRSPAGQVRWMQVNTSPIFGADRPAPEAVVVSYLDVTARHRAESALRESEANYRALFEQMPEGCAVHEPMEDGAGYRFVAVNPAFERMTGVRAAAAAGRGMDEVAPDMARWWTEIYGRVAATGMPVHEEWYWPGLGKHFEVTAYRPGERRFAVILADVTEQREIAARLRESEARYRAIVETAWEGVWQLDAEGRTVFVNGRMAEMLGCTRQEMAGRPAADFMEEPLAAGAAARDCKLRRKDGSELWALVSSTPCFADDGRPAGTIAVMADITRRREAERALAFERAQLLSIFDALESPIYVSDPNTHEVLFVNRALRGALGRDPAGGKCYEQLQQRESPCPFCNNDVIFAEGGGVRHWRFDNPAFGRTYELTDQVIRWPDGRDVRLEFAFDVTDRVRAEAALREAHQLLDTVVEAAPVAIVALDADLRVRRWNRVAEQISGWRAEEVLGRPLPASATPERDAALARILAGETVAAVEFTTRRRDGSPFEVSASGAPLRDAAGRFTGMVIIAMDVSDRKRLEAQLIQAQKLECVGRLAGGVAHDFNNLLTIINGYADLIMTQAGGSGHPLRESAAEIKAAGERAVGLTRQLLTFSRKQVTQPCVLDLNALVSEAQRMLRRLIGEDVIIDVELAEGLGRVKADPGLLHQALVNLAVNARDAMPEGGRLTIRTGSLELSAPEGPLAPGRYVTLSVTDTGTGMDENIRAHLFEPFFTTKPIGRGTGLGLSTVYGVVQQAGGHVTVETAPGKGATFRICLPWAAEPAIRRDAPRPAVTSGSRGHETVLVMEDQAEVRRLVCAALRRFGYRVIEAADGLEAISVAGNHNGPIHLLLADVVMPGMSGKEAAKRLTALRPGLKVLYMSGYAEEVISYHGALEAGVAYIAKPFAPEALAAKVRAVLGDACRVLVVDDESGVRGLLRAILMQGGYEVAEAADGREALAVVGPFRPRIVLLDLVMPDQEGIETMRLLSQKHPDIKIIAMSGAFAGPLLEGTIDLGAHATLAKPISREALLETIRGLESGRGAS